MNEELEILTQQQLPRLPENIRNVLLNEGNFETLQSIGASLGLNEEQQKTLNAEVMLLLLGLSSPKELPQTLKESLALNELSLGTLINTLEEKILEPIYPELVRFYDKEEGERAKAETETPSGETKEVPTPVREKVAPVVPDNLPTGGEGEEFNLEQEAESFIPKLTPKSAPETPTPVVVTPPEVPETPHPFEEKMQKVFTAGAPAMENLALENETEEKPKPSVTLSRPSLNDPYREPIE